MAAYWRKEKFIKLRGWQCQKVKQTCSNWTETAFWPFKCNLYLTNGITKAFIFMKSLLLVLFMSLLWTMESSEYRKNSNYLDKKHMVRSNIYNTCLHKPNMKSYGTFKVFFKSCPSSPVVGFSTLTGDPWQYRQNPTSPICCLEQKTVKMILLLVITITSNCCLCCSHWYCSCDPEWFFWSSGIGLGGETQKRGKKFASNKAAGALQAWASLWMHLIKIFNVQEFKWFQSL